MIPQSTSSTSEFYGATLSDQIGLEDPADV